MLDNDREIPVCITCYPIIFANHLAVPQPMWTVGSVSVIYVMLKSLLLLLSEVFFILVKPIIISAVYNFHRFFYTFLRMMSKYSVYFSLNLSKMTQRALLESTE